MGGFLIILYLPYIKKQQQQKRFLYFLCGTVIKNPPANAGDMGSLVRELDSTCWGATKPMHHNYWAHMPQLLKPSRFRTHALQQEKPPQWEARAPQLE